MKWRDLRPSTNVEDDRQAGSAGEPGGEGPSFGRRHGVKLGLGGVLLLFGVAYLTGRSPAELLDALEQAQQQAPDQQAPPEPGAPSTGLPQDDEGKQFVSRILASTEDTWAGIFQRAGGASMPPKLVLFTDEIEAGCGYSTAAVGPFYCPADQKVYIDLAFYKELRDRFGASGDFAQAYVIAHEVGHHVQELLGFSEQAARLRGRIPEEGADGLSVRRELQADCYAGVWANHADSERHLLEAGDVEEGLNAAAAIGDDRIQKESGGRVHPESWTHGSSAQRVAWFKRGLESGEVSQCDTLGAGSL